MRKNPVTAAQLTDLLGHPLDVRSVWSGNGYAAQPGTGPEGKTCRDCEHYRNVQGGNRAWPKCSLMRASWTGGPGTDIKAKAPACLKFAEESR